MEATRSFFVDRGVSVKYSPSCSFSPLKYAALEDNEKAMPGLVRLLGGGQIACTTDGLRRCDTFTPLLWALQTHAHAPLVAGTRARLHENVNTCGLQSTRPPLLPRNYSDKKRIRTTPAKAQLGRAQTNGSPCGSFRFSQGRQLICVSQVRLGTWRPDV